MQLLRILAGAVGNDMIDQGGNMIIDIHRQGEGTGAVGELKGNSHDAVNYISILFTNNRL